MDEYSSPKQWGTGTGIGEWVAGGWIVRQCGKVNCVMIEGMILMEEKRLAKEYGKEKE